MSFLAIKWVGRLGVTTQTLLKADRMKGRFPEKIGGHFFFVKNLVRRSFRQLAGLSRPFGADQKKRRPKTVKNDTLFTTSSSHGHEVWSIMC